MAVLRSSLNEMPVGRAAMEVAEVSKPNRRAENCMIGARDLKAPGLRKSSSLLGV